ncbi:MAG: cadherin-like domain-containing protein, partial [Desulfobacterales bacterium]|nr:cadherin-like domain-containing protein [Desulfobacterales bacterium]
MFYGLSKKSGTRKTSGKNWRFLFIMVLLSIFICFGAQSVWANNNPTGVDDSASTDEDTPITVAAASGGLLDNDSDTDVDPITATAGTFATTQGGSITIGTDGGYTYDPTGSATLQAMAVGDADIDDTYVYTVNDDQGGSATATLTITVSAVNDDPTGVDDSASTDEDTPITVAAASGGLLDNDS